ncbi:uncharacterized protein EAE98_004964 [Botrytis deweyae]|uniref:Uncharacterized protein n=1 Tax=Botrytis deweyae TaxID=2478750 RepID=A0ABQ7IQ86_9HELO|nr:uncharacterized protein EAE98_004964 [Botrytis deweyae]KAF7930564.1 hypothetical protein EAE98_004964 [Botrytis deweyae]
MEMNGVGIMGCDKLWRKLVDKGSGIKKELQLPSTVHQINLPCPVERDSRVKRRMPTQSVNLKSSPVALAKLRAVIQSMAAIDDNPLLSQSIKF